MFEAWMVTWVLTDVEYDWRKGERTQLFELQDRKLAVDKARWLSRQPNIKRVVLVRIEHKYEACMVECCDVCMEWEMMNAPYEPPTCAVCDGAGHVAENCRAGDSHGYCPDWAM